MVNLRIMPWNAVLEVPEGSNLLEVLREYGFAPDAPCGGKGSCGKCAVLLDGEQTLACGVTARKNMVVTVSPRRKMPILHTGDAPVEGASGGLVLAIDIGTTTVVCALVDGNTGRTLGEESMVNPQVAFGADVISRIQAALQGHREKLTGNIRRCLQTLIQKVCFQKKISPEAIEVVSVVGNPAMQQLFLGLGVENLAAVPFAPVLTEAKMVPCKDILPICPRAELLVVPTVSGYIGADTLGCVLATRLHQCRETTLLVDIGTNGEMVLCHRGRLMACSTAAGPALEGANIRFGIHAGEGAIDHVRLEEGEIRCHVLGGGEAVGICGSGLVDAIAVGLRAGILNSRGRIQNPERVYALTDRVYLTQEDIRQVQLAKGAIAAGICLMAEKMGIRVEEIQKVLLAGAFGSFMDPDSACRTGLLPEVLAGRVESVGNAAGLGAKILACSREALVQAQQLREAIEYLELAELPAFPRTFAKAMRFREACL